MRDFYLDLMVFMSGSGKISKSVWWDMYRVREGLDGGDFDEVYGSAYELLCFVALRLAKSFGVRLPDGLHNRMVLGPQNDRTGQYVAYCGKLAAQK